MIEVKQVGVGHEVGHAKLEQAMHQKRGRMAGAVVYQERLLDFNPEFHPFLNTSFGTAMNQDASFGGTPELILDGGSAGTEWAGSAGAGTWDFADAGKVTIATADNLDNATFDDAGTIDMNNYTAITGKIDLDIYDPINNSINIQFGLAGVNLGNSVDLNDYIDTGDFSEQAFVIPKDDLGIGALTIDEMTITIIRIGGPKPTIKFDDFQIEQTGTPLVFKVTTPTGTFFHVTELRIALVDALSGIVTVAGATENATMPGLSYDKLLGVNSLTNGILFQRVQNGETAFSMTLNNLGDFLAINSNLINSISDGTNTHITLLVEFPEPIILNGSRDDFLSFTLSDDLSGLLQFKAAARGALEI